MLYPWPRHVLRRLSASGARLLLTTSFPTMNNSATGDLRARAGDGLGFSSFWPINLEQPPFALGPPLLAIGMDGEGWDRSFSQRVVGLWELPLWRKSIK